MSGAASPARRRASSALRGREWEPTLAEWRAKNLRPIQALDGVLAQTWEGTLALLGRELGIETVDLTLDQQVRFTHGIIHAILTLLPDRDLPVMAPNYFSSR